MKSTIVAYYHQWREQETHAGEHVSTPNSIDKRAYCPFRRLKYLNGAALVVYGQDIQRTRK